MNHRAFMAVCTQFAHKISHLKIGDNSLNTLYTMVYEDWCRRRDSNRLGCFPPFLITIRNFLATRGMQPQSYRTSLWSAISAISSALGVLLDVFGIALFSLLRGFPRGNYRRTPFTPNYTNRISTLTLQPGFRMVELSRRNTMPSPIEYDANRLKARES